MHRHEKIREILRTVNSSVATLARKEFDDDRRRIEMCDNISEDIQKAYLMITDLKREFEEKV